MIAMAQPSAKRDPLLLPERDQPYRLRAVYEKIVHGCRDQLLLDFGDCFLRFSVDADTDSISSEFQARALASKRGYRSIGDAAPWKDYVNETCGWTWLAVNQQGYWDTILISFETVIPNLLLHAIASSLYVLPIGPLEEIADSKSVKSKKNNKASRQA
jgi:hypothetical protein